MARYYIIDSPKLKDKLHKIDNQTLFVYIPELKRWAGGQYFRSIYSVYYGTYKKETLEISENEALEYIRRNLILEELKK